MCFIVALIWAGVSGGRRAVCMALSVRRVGVGGAILDTPTEGLLNMCELILTHQQVNDHIWPQQLGLQQANTIHFKSWNVSLLELRASYQALDVT